MEELMTILQETNHCLLEVTDVEQRKYEATLKNNVVSVEDCMKEEQVLLLKLKGLDKKREKVLQTFGKEDATFREVIEDLPEDQKIPLESLFQQMQTNLKKYKEVERNARSALEFHLHEIDKKLEKMQGSKGSVYEGHGKVKQPTKSFTSRRV